MCGTLNPNLQVRVVISDAHRSGSHLSLLVTEVWLAKHCEFCAAAARALYPEPEYMMNHAAAAGQGFFLGFFFLSFLSFGL